MFVFTPWAPFTTLRFVPNPLVAVGNSVGFSSDAASLKINPTTRVGCIFGAGEGNVYSHVRFHSMGPFHYAALRPEPSRCRWQLCRVLFRRRIAKNKSDHKGRLYFWCGRRESNPRLQLGKLTCYHYTTPAVMHILYKTKTKVQNKDFLSCAPPVFLIQVNTRQRECGIFLYSSTCVYL